MMQSALLYTGVMMEYFISFSILILLLAMVCCVGGNLLLGRNRYLVRVLDEERSPPAERTVGDDSMLAMPHQLHVAETFLALVPVHEPHLVFRKVEIEYIGILLAPLHAARVAEEHEHGVLYVPLDMLDCPLEVAELIAITVTSEHITTSGMDGHGIATVEECCHFLVLSILELWEDKSLPHLLFYPFHATSDSLQRKPLTSEYIVLSFIEHLLILTITGNETLLADATIGALEPITHWRVNEPFS